DRWRRRWHGCASGGPRRSTGRCSSPRRRRWARRGRRWRFSVRRRRMGVWANTRRLARLLAVLARHGAAHVASRRRPRWRWLASRWPKPVTGPERLRSVFEDLGGTFIKFGQMLALQPDIVSLEYCDALFNLLDRVAPFDMADVERTFVEELGRPPAELFDTFDAKPLATASVGQVHVATLRGRRVAVKVRRPSVEAEFGGDIRLMAAALGLIRRLRLRRLAWVIEPISEFIAW